MIDYLRYLSTINEVVLFPSEKFVSVYKGFNGCSDSLRPRLHRLYSMTLNWPDLQNPLMSLKDFSILIPLPIEMPSVPSLCITKQGHRTFAWTQGTNDLSVFKVGESFL